MKMTYMKLEKYKYELENTLVIIIPIKGYIIDHPFFSLDEGGKLTIYEDYKWDGVSGPMIDTKDSMVGGCVHDALYQMIRLGLIPRKLKPKIDRIMRTVFNLCGMDRFRSTYAYLGVMLFGGSSCVVGDIRIPEPITLEYK